MARIEPINYEQSTGKAKELLDAVKGKLGMTPNMMTTMAQSPAVIEAYLNFSGALSGGALSARLREKIALIAAEVNGCGYCASAHTAIGQMIGLDKPSILAARAGNSSNSKEAAALKFARKLIVNRGQTGEADLDEVKAAGFTDGEIGEIIANVALNIFTNYFNEAVKTDIDFPAIEFPLKSQAAKG
jgi:uncharacterized peroxidase-related enzyme